MEHSHLYSFEEKNPKILILKILRNFVTTHKVQSLS